MPRSSSEVPSSTAGGRPSSCFDSPETLQTARALRSALQPPRLIRDSSRPAPPPKPHTTHLNTCIAVLHQSTLLHFVPDCPPFLFCTDCWQPQAYSRPHSCQPDSLICPLGHGAPACPPAPGFGAAAPPRPRHLLCIPLWQPSLPRLQTSACNRPRSLFPPWICPRFLHSTCTTLSAGWLQPIRPYTPHALPPLRHLARQLVVS